MHYLTAEQVLFIHARLIAETGGAHGVLDLGLLLSAIARPRSTFDGQELYPDLFSKAAALLESLIGNHAFLDGNKRTAIAAAGLFLKLNDFQLTADDSEVFDFTLQCAQGRVPLEKIRTWFETHSVGPG
jgi:death-on-curing protein